MKKFDFSEKFNPKFIADIKEALLSAWKISDDAVYEDAKRLVRGIKITDHDFGDYAFELSQEVDNPIFTQLCLERSNYEYRKNKRETKERLDSLSEAVNGLEKRFYGSEVFEQLGNEKAESDSVGETSDEVGAGPSPKNVDGPNAQ